MGRCIVAGGKPDMTAPRTEIKASDIAVGSSVYIMENGVAVEYLVVNHGIPSGSSLYDTSCDGMWILRKDCKEKRQWHSSSVNDYDYENSAIHAWLNEEFYNQLGDIEKNSIKQVKIPYRAGSGNDRTVTSGENGLSSKIFLLSPREAGIRSIDQSSSINDGAKLDYFEYGLESSALKKRKALFDGEATNWWTRSPYIVSKGTYALAIAYTGNTSGTVSPTSSSGIRPALVLQSNALFDKTTLLLKGVT